MTAKDLALALANAMNNKKGEEVRVLDLHGVCGFADYFVLATGGSDRHVRTLADAAVEAAGHGGAKALGVEGRSVGRWVLVDLGDVVVHVFSGEARDYFGLERLWGDAEELAVDQAVGAAS
ncbi:MAG TPA: ribosome silencing factor [Myxococcota bacterium]|nr:ribosome silencing factor [Myxococcota bacterium]